MRREPFLWIRISMRFELILGRLAMLTKKWADYEQLLWSVFSYFNGQKRFYFFVKHCSVRTKKFHNMYYFYKNFFLILGGQKRAKYLQSFVYYYTLIRGISIDQLGLKIFFGLIQFFYARPKIYIHIVAVTKILCQTKRWFAFSKIGLCAGTTVFWEALNAVKLLGWLKKFGTAQNLLGSVATPW